MLLEFIVTFVLGLLTYLLNLFPDYDVVMTSVSSTLTPSLQMFYYLVTKPVGIYMISSITFWALAYPTYIIITWVSNVLSHAFSAK